MRIKSYLLAFLTANIIEGLLVSASIALIPTDQKNSYLLGFSKDRLALLAASMLLTGIFILLTFNWRKVLPVIEEMLQHQRVIKALCVSGMLGALFLWLLTWYPVGRWGDLAAGYIRLLPLLVWGGLLLLQAYGFTWVALRGRDSSGDPRRSRFALRQLFPVALTVTVGMVLFGALTLFANQKGTGYLFPPGASLSPFQVFCGIVLLVFLNVIEADSIFTGKKKSLWVLLTFILSWGVAFYFWNATLLPCTDDRPGPYPPNYQCYPPVSDAVYTIGSHYTALGEGINHNWLTDKPLYMVFLAVGQWLIGPSIDQYLIFQIAILALTPGFLFLFGKRFSGVSGGIFLAAMAVVVEVNAISLYQNVGSVNVKLENPELLTALLLILLGFALVHWWTHPTLMTGGAISGGILGLACLVRFNPIFIAPFLAIAFAILTWKRPGILFSGLAVFTLTFLLVFAPYALSVKNSEGRNSYLSKIESVISERYTNARTTGKAQAISPVGPIVQSSANLPRSNALNDLSAILSHYLNNEISSLFILPVNLSFLKITDQVKQPIWEIAPNRLIWQSGFTLENLVVLALELFLVTLGVWHARKIMGIAGLSPLLIQVGYHFGNAVSRTSGGRYLEPVNWVVLFYFSIGVALLARWAVRAFQSGLVKATWTVTGQAQAVAPGRMKLGWIMGLFLVVGLVAPAMSLIPSQLPQETGAEINRLAAANFNSTNAVTAEQWNGFLASPNSLVVRGRAYDAQYYSNGFPAPGSASFELLLLGKEHVVVSYFTGAESKQTFANGSDVLLVGCQIGQDHLWGANRLIVHSFAVIQLDQEKRVYIDPAAPWTCGQ